MNAMLVVFAGYCILLIIIGILSRSTLGSHDMGEDYMSNFLLSGRNVGTIGLALSFAATAASAGTFIGGPGLGYGVGLSAGVLFMIPNVATIYFPMAILGKRMNSISRRIGALTLVDIINKRYESSIVSMVSAVVIVLFYIAYMVAQFTAGGRVLEVFMGIPYTLGLLIFGGLVFVYTALGGFRAVVWTDILQGIVMLIGVPIMLIMAYNYFDGFAPLINLLAEEEPSRVFGPGIGNFLPMSMFISVWIVWPVLTLGQPAQHSHLLAFKNARTLNRAILLGSVVAVFYYVIGTGFIGPIVRPIIPGLAAADTVIPSFIIKVLPPWIAGLIIAAPFAAIMSSTDTMIITTTGTIVRNIIKPFKPDATDALLAKLVTFIPIIIGGIVIYFAIRPATFLQLIVTFAWGGLGASFLPALVLGLFWRRATAAGALAGIIVGSVANIMLFYAWNNPLGVHTAVWALAMSFAAVVIGSLMTKPNSDSTLKTFFES